MFGFGQPEAAYLEKVRSAQVPLKVTYGEVGATRGALPAFSRPRHPLARLASPIARQIQSGVTRRYLNGLAELTAA